MSHEQKFDSFIFTHIPKCVGTSFRKYIYKSALKSDISHNEIYIPGYNSIDVRKNFSQLNDEEQEHFYSIKYKVVAMHCYNNLFQDHQSMVKSPFYYTILREPVQRYLSHYFFFNFRNGVNDLKGVKPDDLSYEDFNALSLKHGNTLTKYLAHLPFNHTEVSTFDLEKAKQNLKFNYHSFGLMEDMNLSLLKLRKTKPVWINLENKLPRSNVNFRFSFRKPKVSQAVMEVIKRNNSIDTELYNYAKQLFYDQ